MPQFEITFKNSKVKSYYFIALLIVFLNAAIFIYLLFFDRYFYDAAASFFIIAVYCLFRFYIAKKNKSVFYLDEVSFFILTGCWVALQNYPAAGSCLLMGILYHYSLQKLQFTINNIFIKKTNFPPVEYQWSQLTNVILRDGILTLDFNNNKLLQLEIENVQSTLHGDNKISEVEFNEFAKHQLIKYSNSEENPFLN